MEYRYDEACQLVEARGDVVTSWAYDPGGRMISECAAGRTRVSSYDVAGQVQSMTDADGAVTEYR